MLNAESRGQGSEKGQRRLVSSQERPVSLGSDRVDGTGEVSTAPGRSRRGSALVPALKTRPPRRADGEAWAGDPSRPPLCLGQCGLRGQKDLDLGSHNPTEHEEQETRLLWAPDWSHCRSPDAHSHLALQSARRG